MRQYANLAPTNEELVCKLWEEAEKNYSGWGQWIIECRTRAEILQELENGKTYDEIVAGAKLIREREKEVQVEVF